MGILLIESSSKRIEFGYGINDKVIFKQELEEGYNADTLTFFLKESFERNKIRFTEIEYVSLSNGPGSFTGLRIGSAIAKGICFGNDCRLIQIPTLDIIANKHKSHRKIISLIVSNQKNLEYYYCEYKFENSELIRTTDYGIDSPENIFDTDNADFIINEAVETSIEEKYLIKLHNVSEISNIPSQMELTQNYIKKNIYSDYSSAEPFYMKDFVPKI